MLLLMACSAPEADVPPGDWIRAFDVGSVYGVSADASGNVYVAGVFASERADLGGGEVTSADGAGWLARYAGDGEHVWSQSIGIDAPPGGFSAADDGALFLDGGFSSPLAIGTGAPVGGSDLYVAGWSAEGDLRFARSWGGEGDETLYTLADNGVDAAVGGTYASDGANLDWAAYVASVDASGARTWERRIGVVDGDRYQAVTHVAKNADGYVFAAGMFELAIDVGGIVVAAPEDALASSFFVLYDPSGAPVWAAAADQEVRSVAIGPSGESYVLTARFDGISSWFTLTAYSLEGEATWTSRPGGVTTPLRVDSSGNLWYAGTTYEAFDVGDGTQVEPTGTGALYVASRTADGAWRGGRLFDGDDAYGVCVLCMSGPRYFDVGEGGQVVLAGDLVAGPVSLEVGNTLEAELSSGYVASAVVTLP